MSSHHHTITPSHIHHFIIRNFVNPPSNKANISLKELLKPANLVCLTWAAARRTCSCQVTNLYRPHMRPPRSSAAIVYRVAYRVKIYYGSDCFSSIPHGAFSTQSERIITYLPLLAPYPSPMLSICSLPMHKFCAQSLRSLLSCNCECTSTDYLNLHDE